SADCQRNNSERVSSTHRRKFRPAPMFSSLRTCRIRRSRSANSRTMSPVESVDALSQTRISISSYVWFTTDSRATDRKRSALYAGTPIVTRGVRVDFMATPLATVAPCWKEVWAKSARDEERRNLLWAPCGRATSWQTREGDPPKTYQLSGRRSLRVTAR